MTVKEMIERYNIFDGGNGQIGVRNVDQMKRDNARDDVKAAKADILAYFANIKKAEELRQTQINAIEGLEEIENAIHAWNAYHVEFNRRMENEMLSSISPSVPTVDVDELKDKYPRAAAYLKAKEWANAQNFVKSDIGERAVESIINSDDYEVVIAAMTKEWAEHCDNNIWN